MELGWTLADLAREAGLKSPSYVFHIERGEKVPSAEVAVRLAQALGEDEAGFKAWSQLRGGGANFEDALRSAEIADRAVRAIESDPRHVVVRSASKRPTPEPMAQSYLAEAARSRSRPVHRALISGAPRRPLQIPLLEEGELPRAASADGQVGRTIIVAVDTDAILEKHLGGLLSPFAYKLSVEGARRAPTLLPPGFYAVLTRQIFPLEAGEAYAVRVGSRVDLGFVHWDRKRLLLLPHTDPADLVILNANSEHELERHLVARVAMVAQPETIEVRE